MIQSYPNRPSEAYCAPHPLDTLGFPPRRELFGARYDLQDSQDSMVVTGIVWDSSQSTPFDSTDDRSRSQTSSTLDHRRQQADRDRHGRDTRVSPPRHRQVVYARGMVAYRGSHPSFLYHLTEGSNKREKISVPEQILAQGACVAMTPNDWWPIHFKGSLCTWYVLL